MQCGQNNLDNAHYQIIQTDGSSTQNIVYVTEATSVWTQTGMNVVCATTKLTEIKRLRSKYYKMEYAKKGLYINCCFVFKYVMPWI